MNEGVKILIDRMETNPEDFEDRDFEPTTGRIKRGKFKGVADMLKKRLSGERPAWDAMNVLTTEEIEALTAAYLEMERKRFTNGIMAKLLEDDKLDSYAYTAGPVTAGFIKGINSPTVATISNTGPQLHLNPKNIETLNEMIAAWRKEDE